MIVIYLCCQITKSHKTKVDKVFTFLNIKMYNFSINYNVVDNAT